MSAAVEGVQSRSKWLMIFLLMLACGDALIIVSSGSLIWAYETSGVTRMNYHDAVITFPEQIELVVAFIILIYIFLLVTTMVMYARFVYYVNRELSRVVPNIITISPTMSWVWAIIPIACFWMPYRAMKQIWWASRHPNLDLNLEAGYLLKLWWTAFLVSWIFGYLYNPNNSVLVSHLIRSEWILICSSLAMIASCLALRQVVAWISQGAVSHLRDAGRLAEQPG